MTVLISVYAGRRLIVRCDARCYNARTKEIDCICGGRNHGIGKDTAIEQTRQEVSQWINDYRKKNRINRTHKIVINRAVVDQLTLFDLRNLSKQVAGVK